MKDKYVELIGIYHANGSILGEIKYLLGKTFGITHCALCDITHTIAFKKRTFTDCINAFPIPFKTLHLDELVPELKQYTRGKTPCVVGKTADGFKVILTKHELEQCNGNVSLFESKLYKKCNA